MEINRKKYTIKPRKKREDPGEFHRLEVVGSFIFPRLLDHFCYLVLLCDWTLCLSFFWWMLCASLRSFVNSQVDVL